MLEGLDHLAQSVYFLHVVDSRLFVEMEKTNLDIYFRSDDNYISQGSSREAEPL